MDITIVTVVGAFLSIALSANAFLFKQMVSGLNKVELGLAVLVSEHKASNGNIKELEADLGFATQKIAKLEMRLIKLEVKLNGE